MSYRAIGPFIVIYVGVFPTLKHKVKTSHFSPEWSLISYLSSFMKQFKNFLLFKWLKSSSSFLNIVRVSVGLNNMSTAARSHQIV